MQLGKKQTQIPAIYAGCFPRLISIILNTKDSFFAFERWTQTAGCSCSSWKKDKSHVWWTTPYKWSTVIMIHCLRKHLTQVKVPLKNLERSEWNPASVLVQWGCEVLCLQVSRAKGKANISRVCWWEGCASLLHDPGLVASSKWSQINPGWCHLKMNAESQYFMWPLLLCMHGTGSSRPPPPMKWNKTAT